MPRAWASTRPGRGRGVAAGKPGSGEISGAAAGVDKDGQLRVQSPHPAGHSSGTSSSGLTALHTVRHLGSSCRTTLATLARSRRTRSIAHQQARMRATAPVTGARSGACWVSEFRRARHGVTTACAYQLHRPAPGSNAPHLKSPHIWGRKTLTSAWSRVIDAAIPSQFDVLTGV